MRCDGDGRWAWIPGGGLRSAPFCTANLRPTFLPTNLPTYLPTCLPTYLPTYLLTHKTKLKLDKEVGGGDLAELCTIA